MSNRDLPEPGRALEQLLGNQQRKLRDLDRTATKTSKSRVVEVSRTFFDGGALNDGGFWTEHVMIEFDIEPGSWLLDGELAFELLWNGFNFNAMGYQDAHVIIDWRPLGTPTVNPADRIEFRECPLSYPMNNGMAQTSAWRTVVPASKTVSSEDGLTVRLIGLFTLANSNPSTAFGDDFWLGPGILMATPL